MFRFALFSLFSAGLACGLLLASTQPLHAQDPGSGGPQPGNEPPTAVPIDGGATLLAAAAGAYALRTLRRRLGRSSARNHAS